jgi:ribonucleoside-diphosphate reductase protein NrdI
MLIVYDSLTGQGKKFALKLGYEAIKISEYETTHDHVVFLVTRSFHFGEVPKTTLTFLESYHDRVVGLAVSGNRNWGTNYGKAGEVIEKRYGIPLVTKFEMGGMESDIKTTQAYIQGYLNTNVKGSIKIQ